jgi:hypothetical protein
VQILEGYEAVQAGILSLIHHAHAAAAELANNAVVRDRRVDHGQLSRK